MLGRRSKIDWTAAIHREAEKYGHTVYKITSSLGKSPTRRSYVLWSCNLHPDGGKHSFSKEDSKLKDLLAKNIMTSSEIEDLISMYPGEQFYVPRVDEYVKYSGTQRTACCVMLLHKNRAEDGYVVFQNLLKKRGAHYKTTYTLQIGPTQYKGKHIKCLIKCDAHKRTFSYSMQSLNYSTSCPCLECRIDPAHKNVSVDIVKNRPANLAGRVRRDSGKVKAKYNNTCALSNSTIDLHYHHLDGRDFYTELQDVWQHNGICVAGTIHRDYHNVFLLQYSLVAKEYSEVRLDPSDCDANLSNITTVKAEDPDFEANNAEVSRYTFLEYLKFLIFDIKRRQSTYVNTLNQRMSLEQAPQLVNSVGGHSGKITLDVLEAAIKAYCNEYKGENWALSARKDILFANDQELWEKVDALYNT
uniref:hypothetical protein n=1 Tax=Chlorococcum tatrense TaxID=915274 RepID=UPI0010C51AEB|nr:hypothetical protein [Chlorococcum tatrense]AYQ94321.1 hypothetical protein [Chlorococcum tatrense]